VRGGPFKGEQAKFPEPKCRFGSDQMTVGASYVPCTKHAPKVSEKEGKREQRSFMCIYCENSPPSLESKPIEFTVSLTGDFSDVSSAVPFYYYKPVKVAAIKP